MPSPFPGMDPYLEAPEIWPDFHDALAGEIRAELNRLLPASYYARLEMRPEVGIVEEAPGRRIVLDVTVVRPARAPADSGVAVQEPPRRVVSESFEVVVQSETIRHQFVEIRDPARGHRLVTLIEIVSPSNKQPGPDRRSYERKQREVLGSDASLVELDLLRAGDRLLPDPELEQFLSTLEPPPHYLVLVNRAWRRGDEGRAWQVFSSTVRDPLPCIPVPLREGEEEVPLDLQYVFQRAWDRGPYRRGAVDYAASPRPPLEGDDAAWAAQLLRAAQET